MTEKTIIENCERLQDFLGDKKNNEHLLKGIVINAKGLLYCYGRILDVYGAPASGLSIIFVNEDEYNEMKEFAIGCDGFKDSDELSNDADKYVKENIHQAAMAWCNYFRFNYDGYQWIIKKK